MPFQFWPRYQFSPGRVFLFPNSDRVADGNRDCVGPVGEGSAGRGSQRRPLIVHRRDGKCYCRPTIEGQARDWKSESRGQEKRPTDRPTVAGFKEESISHRRDAFSLAPSRLWSVSTVSETSTRKLKCSPWNHKLWLNEAETFFLPCVQCVPIVCRKWPETSNSESTFI